MHSMSLTPALVTTITVTKRQGTNTTAVQSIPGRRYLRSGSRIMATAPVPAAVAHFAILYST